MSYTYAKLATPTTIRLIQVMPDKVNDTIACIIHTYDTQLRQEGQISNYRALSYRWGSSEYTRCVYLKDAAESEWHQHPVHENLWCFIDHAWQKRLLEDRFWTDYFCLDQSSDEEKSQQIPRMGVIFAEATDVIIWLGLSEIEEHHLERFLGWPKEQGGHVKLPRGEACQPIIDTVKALWKNEYWGCVWVVQEVTLARTATVLTRSLSISLNDLWKAALNASPSRAVDKLEYPSMSDLRNLATMEIKDRQMWDLLRDNVSAGYQCKEPNDRLYGFLRLLSAPNKFIAIDYNRQFSHVILDAILEAAADWPPTRVSAILDNFAVGKTPLGLTTNANELEEYFHAERTLPRHRELSGLALDAFDAMSLMMTTSGAPQSRWAISKSHEALSTLSSHCMQSDTIFMGFTLAYGSSKEWQSTLLKHWKAYRSPRLQKKSWRSPWLCQAHLVEDHMQEYIRHSEYVPSIEEYMQEYMGEHIRRYHDKVPWDAYRREYERVFKMWHNDSRSTEQYMHLYTRAYELWHGETRHNEDGRELPTTREASLEPGGSWHGGMEEACRYVGEHCDGSSMVFEIPRAFFRMTISDKMKLEFFNKDT